MRSILLFLSTVVTFCPAELVDGSDVAVTDQSILRYMANAPKHEVESANQYRKEELDGFFKTGKLPVMSGEAPRSQKMEPKVPTEVLMKQYLDRGTHIKNHFNTTGRGRGPETGTTEAPAESPSHGKGKVKAPLPTHAQKDGKGKKKSPPLSKAAKGTKGKETKNKAAKKVDKKKKGEKSYASDYPSTSPTPTTTMPPVKGDVALSPSLDSGT
jgi:hypothetical protein